MKRSNFFKKISENDDTVVDIDNENKYIYYPSQKNRSIYTLPQQDHHVLDIKEESEVVNSQEVKVIKEEEKKVEKNIEEVIEKKSELKVEMSKEQQALNSLQSVEKFDEEKLLFNLKIISEVNSSDKLSFEDKQFRIDNPTYMQGMYRWWSGEDRSKTLEKLNAIIDATFSYMDKTFTNSVQTVGNSKKAERILYENNSQVMQKFYIALIDAIKGLEKLKSTYVADKSMTTGLDLLINKIRIRTDKINDILMISPRN